MSRPDRKVEIEAIRAHARNAARSGRKHCPYTHCDKMQWDDAYKQELYTMQEEAKYNLRSRVESAETIEDIKSILLEILP